MYLLQTTEIISVTVLLMFWFFVLSFSESWSISGQGLKTLKESGFKSMLEVIEKLQPVIDFTHSTAFGIILCAGWFVTYLVMSTMNKKMRKQCDGLIKVNKDLKNANRSLAGAIEERSIEK